MPMLVPASRPGLPPAPFLVAGLGRAGSAAVTALRQWVAPEMLHCWDTSDARPLRRRAEELQAAGIQTWLGPPPALAGKLASCSVIKSPGLAPGTWVIRQALELGSPVLDELELGWRLNRAPMVAVTGTNGKSTVCSLLSSVFAAGRRGALIAGNTEFGPPLSAVPDGAAEVIVCEVSSFQLEGCPELLPEAAVLTNLRPEHLNRHGTMGAYAACKRRLFVRGDRAVPLAVLNLDDRLGRRLAREVEQRGGTAIGYGRVPTAAFRLRRCGWTLSTGWLEVDTPDGVLSLHTRLPGAHNVENVLAALAAARSLGFELQQVIEGIERAVGVPGRFEQVNEGQRFDVIVDFAHTPDAVSAVIEAARASLGARPGGLVHVLVSVSGHRWRKLSAPIGEAAARLADHVVLTEGSSFGRSRAEMLAPLIAGARSVAGADLDIVPDRRLAIRRVLSCASEGDVVLVLGRGAIPSLSRHRDEPGLPFDDRTVVRSELRGLLAAHTVLADR